MTLPIGLQLYTVRDALKRDFEGSLRQLAAAGYTHVETAGLPQPAAKVRELLDSLGMKACGAHVGLDQLEKDLPAVIDEARTLGYRTVACPWVGDEWRTAAGYRKLAGVLDAIGRQLADAGLQLAYHNHDFEFAKLPDSSTGMDILFGETDPELVHSELDLYWVRYADHDPAAWMTRLAGRIPLIHIKDMTRIGSDKKMTEVGTGVIDYAALARLAPTVGVQYMVIEQDGGWIDNDPIKSATISLANFRKIAG
jgi:sugar phosphate isomerase/epimerase